MSATAPAMSPSDLPVSQVLDRVTGPRRAEADELLRILGDLTGHQPVVWAGKIIGFGQQEYRYDSGHGGIMPTLAFATTDRHHTIYLVSDFAKAWPNLVGRLGPHRTGKSCLHLTRLSKVDVSVLTQLLRASMEAS
jgi:hypothetical protein